MTFKELKVYDISEVKIKKNSDSIDKLIEILS